MNAVSDFMAFSRPEWARLRFGMPLPLPADGFGGLGGLNEPVTTAEIEEGRADLVMKKGADHAIDRVWLRR